MSLYQTRDRLAKAMLHRYGHDVTVERPAGSAPENKYGKVSDEDKTWNTVENTVARRVYDSTRARPRESRGLGGRVDVDSPLIVLPKDSDAQEGDRVKLSNDSKIYYLDQEISWDTHKEFRTTVSNG